MRSAYDRLLSVAGEVRLEEPLSKHTTFRIGGPAALYVECDDMESLSSAVAILKDEAVDWIVLGKGSNVLVSDAGFEGAVIVLGSGFRHYSVDGTQIVAGAGVVLAVVVQESFRRGLSGLEFAVGIPGTLGGAVFMNAGSRETWLGSVVGAVTLFVPGEGLVSVRGDRIDWRYRTSIFPVDGIIVEASLVLEQGDVEVTRAAMEKSYERRKQTQPLGSPNAGSIFVNPPGDSAGRLIESAGLKGLTYGGAMISEVHANFIVNTGAATAANVMALIDRVREVVRDTHGVELTPEIRFIGRLDSP